MTLVVDFAEFVESVKRYGCDEGPCVYYKVMDDSVHLSYANPEKGIQIISYVVGDEQTAKKELESKGIMAKKGSWVTEASLEHLAQLTGEAYVAAVAYETRQGPGLWLDAFPTPPSEGTVLRSIFEEFVTEGLLDEKDYERFLTDARPQVRILKPVEIDTFIKAKRAKGGL